MNSPDDTEQQKKTVRIEWKQTEKYTTARPKLRIIGVCVCMRVAVVVRLLWNGNMNHVLSICQTRKCILINDYHFKRELFCIYILRGWFQIRMFMFGRHIIMTFRTLIFFDFILWLLNILKWQWRQLTR